MKKTMFITSVIMVVVMAIALTTSSLAWFTAAGSATVTTNAMTLEAKATAAEGLLISSVSEAGAWYASIDLATGNAQANMIPAVPYQYADEDEIIDALVGDHFITNTVDMNGKWGDYDAQASTATTESSSSAVLYFAKEFWITTVQTANDLKVGFDTTPIVWTNTDGSAYTSASSDPVIYVAVLASKDVDVAADRSDDNADGTGEMTTELRRADSDNWEILDIFSNTGASTVNMGTEATDFSNYGVASNALKSYANASNGVTISSLTTANNRTTDVLDKVTTHHSTGAALATGEVKRFKVVAWYDGNSLMNSNSNFSLQFSLNFKAFSVPNS